MTRPIVFCTDYGVADVFVGVCHGVMAGIAPDARIIDLSHAVPRQDVVRGALTLSRATPYMPADAVYVAVVDPGVGSERRSIAVRADSGALLVGPDNGVLSLAWESLGGVRTAAAIEDERVTLSPVSKTFHGRDVFAPAAAHLAAGFSLEDVGPSIDADALRVVEMPGPMVAPGAVGTRVIEVDAFGNVQLSARPIDLESAGIGAPLTVSGRTVPLVGIFADVAPGELAVIVDSQGYLALVVNRGSAAQMLELKAGSAVVLE
ncbi:MAG: SAM-dependent chlorinase/fluorinase [Actinomycetota bacterium]|nr:SAM-dependent chlorinase/fluorinase [Actinomycetota bacterium]MDH5223311.1 SAM-dependent chlorinase/fluorinase [Actinomycetota bacterium]MDH5313333.1 SAM-dependent chlorinase/fluorinase [Actinomycetota bacterium]